MSLYVELMRHFSLLFRKRLISVDLIIKRSDNSIIFVKRGFPPYKGYWALPGGFVKFDETLEEAAVREAKEETGLDIELKKLAGVFSKLNRDPRGRILSVAFAAKVIGGEIKAGSDAKEVKAFKTLPKKLAFDHAEILKTAEV